MFVEIFRCCCEVLDLQAAVALQVRFCCPTQGVVVRCVLGMKWTRLCRKCHTVCSTQVARGSKPCAGLQGVEIKKRRVASMHRKAHAHKLHTFVPRDQHGSNRVRRTESKKDV